MNIHVYTDPGHGWAAVKTPLLADLGIADKVSSYSYLRGGTAYLEEDCDLSLLVSALRQRGIAFEFIEHHTDRRSPIRSYLPYRAEPQPLDPEAAGDAHLAWQAARADAADESAY